MNQLLNSKNHNSHKGGWQTGNAAASNAATGMKVPTPGFKEP